MPARKPIAASSRQLQDPVVDRIPSYVERVGADGVSDVACLAATAFIADTFAVEIAGLAAPGLGEGPRYSYRHRRRQRSTVFHSGEPLPLIHAAMLNAWQIHAQEFDCVHARKGGRPPNSSGAAGTVDWPTERATFIRPGKRSFASWRDNRNRHSRRRGLSSPSVRDPAAVACDLADGCVHRAGAATAYSAFRK